MRANRRRLEGLEKVNEVPKLRRILDLGHYVIVIGAADKESGLVEEYGFDLPGRRAGSKLPHYIEALEQREAAASPPDEMPGQQLLASIHTLGESTGETVAEFERRIGPEAVRWRRESEKRRAEAYAFVRHVAMAEGASDACE